MEAINPDDTHAVQIQSVDNLVNEIRKLTKNLDTRNSSVRSPPAETYLLRSPQDSQSQFFHPYKESMSREPERELRLEENGSGFPENHRVASRELSGLHSKLDDIIKNSYHARRVSSNDVVNSPGITTSQELFHMNSQEANIRNNAQTTGQYSEQHELGSPGLQVGPSKPIGLSIRSEVVEKFPQGPPSLSRMPMGPNEETVFHNPFSSNKPTGIGAIKSPVHDTPDYKKAMRSHNISALDVGLRSPVDTFTSNYATNPTTSVSAGLKGFKNLDSILGQIDTKSSTGFPQTLHVARATSLNGIRLEDQIHPSSVQDFKPTYDRSKLDQILNNIKNRGPTPSSRIASIRVGTTERSQLGFQQTQTEHKNRVGNFPPSLDIPKINPYDSVPQNKTGLFTPVRTFPQPPQNPVQNLYYTNSTVNQFSSPQMGGNYYELDPGSLTSLEDPADLRASHNDVRENLHYNEYNYHQYQQHIPQAPGYYNQEFRSPGVQRIEQEEEPEQHEFQPKPKRRASKREEIQQEIKRGSRRNSMNRKVEEPKREEVLWGQVENDDDSLVMHHLDKSGVKKVAEKFGSLEDDSVLSRASLQEEEEGLVELEEVWKPQVNDSRNRSLRRERSKQRSAKKQEVSQQMMLPDSIFAENLALGESISTQKQDVPVQTIQDIMLAENFVLGDSISAEPATEINFLLTTEQEQPSVAAAMDKSTDFVTAPKKSTYTYGQELRRGGSISKQVNQEKAPRSSKAQLGQENSFKSNDLLSQFEKSVKTTEITVIKKRNSYQDNNKPSEILSDFELRDRSSNIEMSTSQQKEPVKEIEQPYHEEDSITKAFEHAKLENSPPKKSQEKNVKQTESRGLVAQKTEVIPKSKGFRRKPIKW